MEDPIVEITKWDEAEALDGFIALPGGSMKSLDLFFKQLMPMLSEKGLFKKPITETHCDNIW
ncbi:hypothetical protein [Lysinibacillus sp. LZ02]|uniref:hypothetical protein n=1 Tax=Lysinibacillus sp. LZ02 TaxID=3420668 RepID=UPI003D3600DC